MMGCSPKISRHADDELPCCWMEKKFVDDTTCHGLSCVFSHQSTTAKLMWITILTCKKTVNTNRAYDLKHKYHTYKQNLD